MNPVPTLPSIIKQAIDNRLKDLHTSCPGIVESFDPVTQTASIQPAIKRIFVTDDGEKEILTPSPLPLLINVPIVFPRGGGFSLTFPVKKGDECHIQFCERSIDIWHEKGEVCNPGARRFHSLSDAVAYVGLSSIPNKIDNYDENNTVLMKDDGTAYISLRSDSSLEIISNNSVTVEAPSINLEGNVNVNGNISVTGDTSLDAIVTSNGIDISATHKHAGSATAPSGPITPTGTPV